MTRSQKTAALLAAIVLLAGGLTLLSLRGGGSPAPDPGSAAAPTPVPTAAAPRAQAAVAPAPAAPRPGGPNVVTIMPDETPDPALPYPEAAEPFIWEETLDRLLGEANGDVMAVYAKLTPMHRENLIDLLTVRGELRPWLDDILGTEEDSAIREYLVFRMDPVGLDDLENGFQGDPELVTILETPTKTPIEAGEWHARLMLSGFADEDYALRMARESGELFGDDAKVSVAANSLLLNLASGRDDVSRDELRRAEDALYTWLGPDGGGRDLPAADQIGGLTALAHASDADRARALYQELLDSETDPQLRQALESLLRNLP
jgi:hypothetical protein